MNAQGSPYSIRDLRRVGSAADRICARRQARAFTIVELVVVLLVMSIMAAAAAPTFYDSLCYHRLESAARRVKQDLEYLRDSARARSATLTCEFDEDALGYSFTEESILHLDHSQAYSVDLSIAPYVLGSMTADFGGDTTVSFDGYGNLSSGGVIQIGMGGNTRTITLDGATGQITIANP